MLLVRIAEASLVRPKGRIGDVTTTLADLAIVTYDVAPERLARHLPAGFTPDVVEIGGHERALVSAVPFRDLDFRFGFAPFLRFSFGQTNYRAYVRRGSERCVWFFGTSLDTFWVWVPRHHWKLPWHRARIRFDCHFSDERCVAYRMDSRSAWGAADLTLVGTDEPTGCMDGFRDDEETALVLTHPLVGYFERRDGRIGTYSVWHHRLALLRARVEHARFEVLERLGVIDVGQTPHSALVQRSAEFMIRLPPRRVENEESIGGKRAPRTR
jgi:uncharacterized protein YqjF (DUF2071 family)